VLVGIYDVTAQNFSKKDLKQLTWILGNWKMQTKNGWLCEQWHVVNDSTLRSKGFIVKTKGDTLLLEAVQIRLRNKKLYYVPTVKGQNNNEPVNFLFTDTTPQSFTAENPTHDFPRKFITNQKVLKPCMLRFQASKKIKTGKKSLSIRKNSTLFIFDWS
jgi:hypothetical protein